MVDVAFSTPDRAFAEMASFMAAFEDLEGANEAVSDLIVAEVEKTNAAPTKRARLCHGPSC